MGSAWWWAESTRGCSSVGAWVRINNRVQAAGPDAGSQTCYCLWAFKHRLVWSGRWQRTQMKANIINKGGKWLPAAENVTTAFVICPFLVTFNDRASVGMTWCLLILALILLCNACCSWRSAGLWELYLKTSWTQSLDGFDTGI